MTLLRLTLGILGALANQAVYAMDAPILALEEQKKVASTYEGIRDSDFEHHLQALNLPLEQLFILFREVVKLNSVALTFRGKERRYLEYIESQSCFYRTQ